MDEPRNSRKTGDGERSDGRERVGLGRGPVSRRRLLGMTALGVAGIGASSGATARSLARMLTVKGTGEYTEYALSVSGDLAEQADLSGEDDVSGSTATGAVAAGRDSYQFSGAITGFDLSGDATLLIDGERTDPADLSTRTLAIEGVDTYTEYAFSASGGISPRDGLTGEDHIYADGKRASGAVAAGRDSYRFSGEITAFSMSSDAKLFLDGVEVDITSLLSHTLAIEGTGPRADYSLHVSGGIAGKNGHSGEDDIDIERGRVDGAVGGGRDSYAFSGDLLDFDLDGDADVFLDGDRLDLATPAENTLTFASNGGRFSYEFSVSGVLEKSDARGASIDAEDSISDGTATGQGGDGGRDSYAFSGELIDLDVAGDVTVYRNGEEIDGTLPPLLGIYSGLSDADFETIQRMEEWQGASYPVQNLFVPWNADEGHMDWLFEHVLPKIQDAGRVPLVTWEPFTPGAEAASVDTRTRVERGSYEVHLGTLADTTPNDIGRRIADGEYDRYIDRWAGRLRDWLAGPDGAGGTADDRRAYIRLAHEMNGDWYPWSPTVGDGDASSYVDMWRHVHRRFEANGIGPEHVQWMWCVNAEDVGSYTAEELYPGDEYVDWCSVDGYQWGESQNWSDWRTPEDVFGEMLGRVRNLADKPLCVAETASGSKTRSGHDPERKDEWIREAFEFFDREGIEMWCWFNEDKETDWAMFDGVRGTETVTHDGEPIEAYAAYREAIESSIARTGGSEPMTTAAFTGER